jgi:hypothetical protein
MPVPGVPFPVIGVPAVFALFAAAVARKRLAPLVRFTRVTVVPVTIGFEPPILSRSTRRRNGLGKFSSSCMSYTGAAGVTPDASAEVTVRLLLPELDDDDDDDDDDDEDDEQVVIVGSSSCSTLCAATASTRLKFDREDTDGRRRRVGGAGATRVGTSTATAFCDCDELTDLRFEGDLGAESARLNVGAGAAEA